MNILMLSSASMISEGLVAEIARIRFISSVRSKVSLQLKVVDESFLANAVELNLRIKISRMIKGGF